MNFHDFKNTLHFLQFLERCAKTYERGIDRMNFYALIAAQHLFPNSKHDIAVYNYCMWAIRREAA